MHIPAKWTNAYQHDHFHQRVLLGDYGDAAIISISFCRLSAIKLCARSNSCVFYDWLVDGAADCSRPRVEHGRKSCFEISSVTLLALQCSQISTKTTQPVAPPGGRGEVSPLWVDVQQLCNMCVLSLSWNFFVSHDKYIARPSSKEPRWYTDNTIGTGGLRTLDPL